MLSSFVGAVDGNSALVLCVGFVCFAAAFITVTVKLRSRLSIEHDYDLAKMKQEAENARQMYAVETDRGYKYKQIEQGLITSHSHHHSG